MTPSREFIRPFELPGDLSITKSPSDTRNIGSIDPHNSHSTPHHNGRHYCCQAHHGHAATQPGPRPWHRSWSRLCYGQCLLVRLPHASHERSRCLLRQVGAAEGRGSWPEAVNDHNDDD